MNSAGYPLGAALSFLLMLSIGGAIGALVGAVLADRYGIKPVTSAFFLCAAVSLLLVAATPPLAVVYPLVLLVGMGATAGIGFTVALFIADLAYGDRPELHDPAVIAILVASVLAGVAGQAILRAGGTPRSSTVA